MRLPTFYEQNLIPNWGINVTFYNNKDAYSNILPNFAPNYLYLLTS